PLVLDATDSGAAGHNVVYKALPGPRPIINGAVQLTGWTLSNPAKHLWTVPAPPTLKNTRQLYIDGVRKPRTAGRPAVALTQTDTGYTAASDAMSHWRNPADIEFVYTGGDAIWSERSAGMGGWTEPRCPVASIQGKTVTMAQPCWNNSTKRVMLPPDSRYKRPANLVGPATLQGKSPAYIENVFEFLNTPGQWYFDRAERKIYYLATDGEDPNKEDVEIPVLEQLIVGNGQPGKPVHNLIFSDLQFSYATWLFPSSGEGFSEIQANYLVTGPDGYSAQGLASLVPGGKEPFAAWTKAAGNVSFSHDHDIQFLNCAFTHLGAAGLDLGNGSQFDTVQGCIFTDTSGNGMELGDVTLPNAIGDDITRNNRIVNNHIYNIGAEFHGAIGICIGYAQHTLVAHNQIDHVPYSGISIGWGGWLDKIRQSGLPNFSQNNVLAQNHIFNHMLLLSDGGGIYNQGLTGPDLTNGEKIIGNFIHDQFGHGHGIYTDNGSGLVTIKYNVFARPNHDNWAAPRSDYRPGKSGPLPFDVEENYWQGNEYKSDHDRVVKNNHIIAEASEAPADLTTAAGLQPEFKSILNERFGKPGPPAAPNRVSAEPAVEGAIVTWNPAIFDGDAPIQSYIVTASDGTEITVPVADYEKNGFAKITGLKKENVPTFTVKAVNSNGAGAPSIPSRPLAAARGPVKPPGAPAIASADIQDGRLSFSYHAPENVGGSPVLHYNVTIEPEHRTVAVAGRAAVAADSRHSTYFVVDDVKGEKPQFSFSAVNDAGEGPAVHWPAGKVEAPTKPATEE
ncbi:MAG TPA: right-handed parallel beta-helix repeat-containing protein, partial [Desulfuromonadaceae bacterium]|nr:right-handed parallel beta-helix repeat-containing protein [Desulfuromonadaceae bacterium]